MPQVKIKALRQITDGGHNIAKGQTETVSKAYADQWVALRWADVVAEKSAK